MGVDTATPSVSDIHSVCRFRRSGRAELMGIRSTIPALAVASPLLAVKLENRCAALPRTVTSTKLTYVRGPSGIIVMLAEELKKDPT